MNLDLFTTVRQPDDIATHPMIDHAIDQNAVVVFSLSGGKDCGAVLALANGHLDRVGHPRDRRICIHADLGRAEWKSSLAQVRAQAAAVGLELIVVSRGAGDLPARFENRWRRGLEAYRDLRLYNMRGPWSSPTLKFCQSELKIQVMGPELARRFKGQTIVQVTGLRREESAARRSTEVAKIDARFAKPGNRAGTVMLMWNPGVDMTTAEVFAANARHGIPLAESYSWGCSRHSCAFCIMGSDGDLTNAGRAPSNADTGRLYIDMEIRSTFSFQQGAWLADKMPHLLSAQDQHRLADAKIAALRRREIEAALPARHRYVDGWPLYLPTIEEASAIAAARHELLAYHGLPNLYLTPVQVRDRFADLLDQKAKKGSKA